jgi:subtilisin family serine protease
LHLPDAWATATGEGVVVAVLDTGIDPDAADLDGHLLPPTDVVDDDGQGFAESGTTAASLVVAAAPDVRIRPVRVLDDEGGGNADDLATGIAEAADDEADVIALTLAGEPDALAALDDETVQRAITAATDGGSVVVVADPGPGVELADDLPIVLVTDDPQDDDRAVSAGDVDALRSTSLVAGTAALLTGEAATPEEVGDVLVNTAQGTDRVVDAAAAVIQQANVGAGGQPLPPPEDLTGGLSPGTIGFIVFGAAITAIGGTIWIATRGPRRPT